MIVNIVVVVVVVAAFPRQCQLQRTNNLQTTGPELAYVLFLRSFIVGSSFLHQSVHLISSPVILKVCLFFFFILGIDGKSVMNITVFIGCLKTTKFYRIWPAFGQLTQTGYQALQLQNSIKTFLKKNYEN